MKHPHLQDYRPEHTQLCETALLTVWDILDDYRADLVLIGGLVPRYICKASPDQPVAGTLDVDLGIAVGVRGTAHQRIACQRQAELEFPAQDFMFHFIIPVLKPFPSRSWRLVQQSRRSTARLNQRPERFFPSGCPAWRPAVTVSTDRPVFGYR